MRRNEFFEFRINLFLHSHNFNNNFDHHICASCRFFHIQSGLDAAKNCIHLFLRDFAFFRIATEIFLDRVHSSVNEALFNITHAYFITCLRANLSDSIAHQTGAQHTNFLDFHFNFPFSYIYLVRIKLAYPVIFP